ncbi:MAG TPA: NADH-quinone oxidoreductase subunit A [Candidatus Thalassarchaeaceae archaeon]|nr:NADH-quinone oxidoreductase subunit A [Candidatus Thalassarchaeaceae archaeon]
MVVESVPTAYLGLAIMTVVGIGFPLGAFVVSKFLRPTPDPNNPNKLRSLLLDGLESDNTLHSRVDSTYECGSDPVGDAMIDFHFQYYWYAIIFLVFDIAFMFLAFGGLLSIHSVPGDPNSIELALGGVVTVTIFLALMGLGVWHAFRKRGRIYI